MRPGYSIAFQGMNLRPGTETATFWCTRANILINFKARSQSYFLSLNLESHSFLLGKEIRIGSNYCFKYYPVPFQREKLGEAILVGSKR